MEWVVAPHLVDYPAAVAAMEEHVAAMVAGQAGPRVWLVEHPPLYTAGTSAQAHDLRDPRFPVFESGRGGQYTYHGPGQRVAYAMLDLRAIYGEMDLRRYVHDLEEWIIRSLADLGVVGERRAGRVGIWVSHPDGREEKIAAIGIRVRRGISFHGVSINVNPDLSHFAGIVPCGIAEHGVTSLSALGRGVSLAELDLALKSNFITVFQNSPKFVAKPPSTMVS